MSTKTAIGRIVRFISSTGKESPAIINAVHSEDVVSLYVFEFGATPYPATSVQRADDLAKPFSWHWPPQS